MTGDSILITRNNYSLESLLFNGMIVQVEKVSPEVEIHRPLVGKKQIELKFRRISFSVDGIKTQAYLLDDFLNDKSGSLSIEQQKALWADFEQRMRQRGITPKEAELEFYVFDAGNCRLFANLGNIFEPKIQEIFMFGYMVF